MYKLYFATDVLEVTFISDKTGDDLRKEAKYYLRKEYDSVNWTGGVELTEIKDVADIEKLEQAWIDAIDAGPYGSNVEGIYEALDSLQRMNTVEHAKDLAEYCRLKEKLKL